MVRQLLAEGLLAVEGDYGTLALTEASAEVLGRRRTVTCGASRSGPASGRSAKPRGAATVVADLAPAAAPVFERLRAWRAATAKEQGVPAYVIFHDATLRQIATEAPDLAGRAVPDQRRRRQQAGQVRRGILAVLAES